MGKRDRSTCSASYPVTQASPFPQQAGVQDVRVLIKRSPHHRRTFAPTLGIAALALLTCGGSSATAGLIVSAPGSVTRGSGSFEVTLKNTDSFAYVVSGFQYDLSFDSGSNMQFTQAVFSGVINNYIFDGVSFDENYGYPLNIEPLPAIAFTANDLYDGLSGVTINPGQSFSLGLISYESTEATGSDPVNITLSGDQIVASPLTTAVPEPSNLAAGLTGAAPGLIVLWRSRRSASSPMLSS